MARIIFPSFGVISIVLYVYISTLKPGKNNLIPPPAHRVPQYYPLRISKEAITPLKGTKHLLVSAYTDRRVSGFHLRIIGIFRRDSTQALYCLFWCRDHVSTATESTILHHSDNFGFPYVTTDVMCTIPQICSATHVTLLTDPHSWRRSNPTWLPIRNLKTEEAASQRFNFTVCISSVFGRYNNVLQFAQSLETYR